MGLCQKMRALACPHQLVLVASGGGLLLICHLRLSFCWRHFGLESEAPTSNDSIFVLTRVEGLLMQTLNNANRLVRSGPAADLDM